MSEKEILWHWHADGKEWHAWKEGDQVFYGEVGNPYEWHDKALIGSTLAPLIVQACEWKKQQDAPEVQ